MRRLADLAEIRLCDMTLQAKKMIIIKKPLTDVYLLYILKILCFVLSENFNMGVTSEVFTGTMRHKTSPSDGNVHFKTIVSLYERIFHVYRTLVTS